MINLYSGRTIEDFWEAVLLPWFHKDGRDAWRKPLPTVVVAPTMEVLHHLKGLLFETGIPYFAVRLVLADDLRRELAPLLSGSRLPSAKLLPAIVQAAAADVYAADPTDTVAAAVFRGPHTLAETIEVLHQGGWGASEVDGATMRKIARRVEDALRDAGLATAAQLDHGLSKTDPAVTGPRFQSVLAVGFDARHWKHWPILNAAARFSVDFNACLSNPSMHAEQADLVWTGSFEALGGQIQPVSDDLENEAMMALASSLELDNRIQAEAPVHFLAASNLTAEARLVVERTAHELAQGAKSVAILVPGPGVLARELTINLDRLEIPYYNGIPVRRATLSDPEVWSALMSVVAEPTVPNLLAFLRLRSAIPSTLFPRETSRLIYTLDREGANFIFPEINLLGRHLSESTDSRAIEVGGFLLKWRLFSKSDTLGNYLKALDELLESLEWGAARRALTDAANGLLVAKDIKLTLEGFAEFIRDVILDLSPSRSAIGSNPHARVHVLRPEDAVARRWDVVIFAGQNDGVWPPRVQPGGYLSNEDLVALNTRIKALNERVTTQGASGEGHFAVRPGSAYMVGPFEFRALHVRDFVRLVEASCRIYICAAAEDEVSGGAAMHPGELYLRAYRAIHGHAFSRDDMLALAQQNEGTIHPSFLPVPVADVDTTQMMTAWKARRDRSAKEFSNYEFSLNEKPTWDLNIPASAWGKVFDRPAEVFLRHVIGVTPASDLRTEMPWGMVSGNWTHGWLQAASPTGPTPSPEAWLAETRAAAKALHSQITRILGGDGRAVPTWWSSLWMQSLANAEMLATAVSAAARHTYVITEAKIPRTMVPLPSGRSLPVDGRLDLLFADALPINAKFAGSVWLDDYKTGADKPLTPKELAKGKGIQLSLYALAVKALGADSVDISLQRPGDPAKVQVTLDDVMANIAIIEKLADMVESGRFGYHGPIRSEFPGSSTYPIATLSASLDNKEKFQITHGI